MKKQLKSLDEVDLVKWSSLICIATETWMKEGKRLPPLESCSMLHRLLNEKYPDLESTSLKTQNFGVNFGNNGLGFKPTTMATTGSSLIPKKAMILAVYGPSMKPTIKTLGRAQFESSNTQIIFSFLDIF